MPSTPAGPAPWAQTAWQQAGQPWRCKPASHWPRNGVAGLGWVLKRVNTRGVNCAETSKRGASQEGLWGQIDTELAARRPFHGSGRHLGQQGSVPKEELLACSAAVPLKRGFCAVNRSPQVARGVCSLKPMQVCFVRGLSSPCSQARHLAHIAPVSKGHSGPPESARGPTQEPTDRNWNRANPGHAKRAGRATSWAQTA
jgi:hypothetical protein